MTRLHVGLPTLRGDLRKYSDRFDLLELRPVDTSLPRASTLRTWRTRVPANFAFSVILPRVVGELVPGKELDKALESALDVARTLEARCIVLQTPASVRPTALHKKRLAELIERVPRLGLVRCWEPTGIWEREDIVATARSLRVVPVLDAAQESVGGGSVVYTRLRALGKTNALSAAAIERIADRLRSRREVYVVVEGAGEATRLKTSLGDLLAKKRVRRAAPVVIRPFMSNQLIAEDEEQ